MKTRRAFLRNLTGVLVLRCAVFGAVFLPISVNANPNLDLLHLQVFAKQSIRAERSDFQGPTAAGSGIDLSDFEIGGDLSSFGPISFTRGSVTGLVSSPVKNISNVFYSGSGTFNELAFDLASMNLDLLSSKLSSLRATETAQTTSVENGDKKVTNIMINAASPFDVVDLLADQLISDPTNHRNIMLNGDKNSHILVRVSGKEVKLRDLGFIMSGDLSPSQVAFYFPDAVDLEVVSSGGAISPDGTSWGIPGSLVAPHAALRFGSVLITGQVFVKEIAPADGFFSGQVNRMPPVTSAVVGKVSNNELTPSEVLDLVNNSAFAAGPTAEVGRILPRFASGVANSRESLRCVPHLCTSCD